MTIGSLTSITGSSPQTNPVSGAGLSYSAGVFSLSANLQSFAAINPKGGSLGQVLVKNSNSDLDVSWATPIDNNRALYDLMGMSATYDILNLPTDGT